MSPALLYDLKSDCLKKEVVKAGCGFYCPRNGSTCTVVVECDNVGLVENLGKALNTEFEVVIGEYDTPQGYILDSVLFGMKRGEKSEINLEKKVQAQDTDTNDNQGKVTNKLTVELKDFDEVAEIWQMGLRQKLDIASRHKARGTDLFKQGDIPGAFSRFNRAATYLICMGREADILCDLKHEWKLLSSQVYLNISMCQMKYENYESVIEVLDRALKQTNDNVKGLYRRGCAHLALQHYDEAVADLERAAQIEPANTAVRRELAKASQHRKAQNTHLSQAISKMFH